MVDKLKDFTRWFIPARLGIITIGINILFIIYLGVSRMNTVANTVQIHSTQINKLEVQMEELDRKKLDKETFYLINTTLTDMKVDIRDMKGQLMEHMNATSKR